MTAYTPVTWVNDVTRLDAANLNHIEQGILYALRAPQYGTNCHVEFGIRIQDWDAVPQLQVYYSQAFAIDRPAVILTVGHPAPAGGAVFAAYDTNAAGFRITKIAGTCGSCEVHFIAIGQG